jgi:hypothetical protein
LQQLAGCCLEIKERVRSKKCFDALFNFEATSSKLLQIVEQLARSNSRYQAAAPIHGG